MAKLIPPRRGESAIRELVAWMRSSRTFDPFADMFLDTLFAELLARGSRDLEHDARRLQREVEKDGRLARAVQAEYVTAYAAAVAYVAMAGANPKPEGVWAAATSVQARPIDMFVRAIKASLLTRLVSGGSAITQAATSPTLGGLVRIKASVDIGLLLGVDHDVVWGHAKRSQAEETLRWKSGRARDSVASLVRRQRQRAADLGFVTEGARKDGRKWLKEARRTLWFARLQPLHPAMVQPAHLDRIANAIDAPLASLRKKPARTLRKERPAPTKIEEVRLLLPDDLWDAIRSHLPSGARIAVLAVLVVLHCGIPWASLPSALGLGSGAAALRAVRAWQTSGAWPAVEGLLRVPYPNLELGRLKPAGEPVTRARRKKVP